MRRGRTRLSSLGIDSESLAGRSDRVRRWEEAFSVVEGFFVVPERSKLEGQGQDGPEIDGCANVLLPPSLEHEGRVEDHQGNRKREGQDEHRRGESKRASGRGEFSVAGSHESDLPFPGSAESVRRSESSSSLGSDDSTSELDFLKSRGAGRVAQGLSGSTFFAWNRKSQNAAPSMRVCVRSSLIAGLKPSIKAKSRTQER